MIYDSGAIIDYDNSLIKKYSTLKLYNTDNT